MNNKNKIISYIQHIYTECDIPDFQQKTSVEIEKMNFEERKNHISEILLIPEYQSAITTKKILENMANGFSIKPTKKIIGEIFYTHIHKLPQEEQLKLSTMLHFIMSKIINKWADSLIHAKQIFQYIALPYINKEDNINITRFDIQGKNISENFMHLYALAQDKIHDEKNIEKIKKELSFLFYITKHITNINTVNAVGLKNIQNIQTTFWKILDIKNIDDILEIQKLQDFQNINTLYSSAKTAAEIEEKILGNIFDSNLSLQTIKKVNERENPFPEKFNYSDFTIDI